MRSNRAGSGTLVLLGLLAGAVALVGVAADPAPVAAECDGPPPSFRDALATAKRVVIGDVVAVRDGGLAEPGETDGSSSRFTLHVLHVPVGAAPSMMVVSDLPTQPCAGVVQAREGDLIAIAFDATDYAPPMQVNTVAWIHGVPWADGVETTSVNEIYRLLGLTLPDTSSLADQQTDQLPIGLVLALLAGALGGCLAWRRGRVDRGKRRSQAGPSPERHSGGSTTLILVPGASSETRTEWTAS